MRSGKATGSYGTACLSQCPPNPFGRHSAVASRLIVQVGSEIEAAQCGAEVLNEIDWIVNEKTVVRPDVLIVCDGIPPKHVESAPTLIAEVLSDATRERDQTIKRDLYREEGVDHWIPGKLFR